MLIILPKQDCKDSQAVMTLRENCLLCVIRKKGNIIKEQGQQTSNKRQQIIIGMNHQYLQFLYKFLKHSIKAKGTKKNKKSLVYRNYKAI